MIRFFSQINFISIILLPLYILGYLYLSSHFAIGSYSFENQPLFTLGLWGDFPIDKTINLIYSGVLVLINSLLVAYIFNTHNFFDKNTLLPAFVYAVLMTNTREIQVFDGALIFQLLLLFSINILAKLTFNKQNFEALFNLGFITGLGATLFPAYYVMIPLVYVVSLFQTSFKVRELLLYIAGCIIPQFFIALWLLYQNKFGSFPMKSWFILSEHIPLNYLFDCVVLLATTFFSILYSRDAISNLALAQKKIASSINSLLILWSIFAVFMYFRYESILFLQLIIIPLTFITSISLLKSKNSFILSFTFLAVLVFSYFKFFFK